MLKKQTVFSLFIISLVAFLLVLVIGVEEPDVEEREISQLAEGGFMIYEQVT